MSFENNIMFFYINVLSLLTIRLFQNSDFLEWNKKGGIVLVALFQSMNDEWALELSSFKMDAKSL